MAGEVFVQSAPESPDPRSRGRAPASRSRGSRNAASHPWRFRRAKDATNAQRRTPTPPRDSTLSIFDSRHCRPPLRDPNHRRRPRRGARGARPALLAVLERGCHVQSRLSRCCDPDKATLDSGDERRLSTHRPSILCLEIEGCRVPTQRLWQHGAKRTGGLRLQSL